MPADQPSPRATTGGGVLHPATEGILDAAAEFMWSSEVRARTRTACARYRPIS